jgi:hypothetical protein
MSQDREMNSPGEFGEFPNNVESLLRQAAPEDLTVDRDELFFRAGFAAGSTPQGARYVWPAVAASLLVVCAGLSAALLSRINTVNSLQLAVVELKSSQSIAVNSAKNGSTPKQTANDAAVAEVVDKEQIIASANGSSFSGGAPLRNWQRLASSAQLPPGQLTAAGWERRPVNTDSRASSIGHSESDATVPRRPATYLELLRSYQEG